MAAAAVSAVSDVPSPTTTPLWAQIANNITPITNPEIIPHLLQLCETYPDAFNTCYLLIGANVPENGAFDTTTVRHHEFPMIIRRLFLELNRQLSPALIAALIAENTRSHELEVVQTIFLVDPAYKDKQPLQFINEMRVIIEEIQGHRPDITITYTGGAFVLTQTVEFAPNFKVIVTSTIIVYIVPHEIDPCTITSVLTIAEEMFADKQKFLLVVMDFTNRVTNELYITNEQPNVFFTPSDCMFEDNKPENVPIITFDSNWENIRWLNHRDDAEKLSEYADITATPNGFACWSYLKDAMARYMLHVVTVGLLKLCQLASLTCPVDSIIESPALKFSELTFEMFTEYLKRPVFVDIVKYRVGTFYKFETMYVISKLTSILGYEIEALPTNCPLEMCMQRALVIVLRQMQGTLPHIVDFDFRDDEVDRKFISIFLQMHNVRF